ncbi:MAG: glycosyltransferase, partial [Myxococcales bacterium]
ALELQRLGARVTFVEPANLKTTVHRLHTPPDAPEGLRVLGMPPSVPRLVDRLPVLPDALDLAQSLYLRKALLDVPPPVAIVSTPRWAPVLRGLRFSAVFYDCLDDLAVHAEPERQALFEAWERELLARADGSFAVSPALVDVLKARGGRNVLLSRNGVAFEAFRAGAAPADLKTDRKRIGYLGALYEWVDFGLLADVARRLPRHEFYLVGPVRRGLDVSDLERLPNVRLTGHRAYPLVPRAMASFDVALIPFKEGDIARAADPIKIYEYFCFGLPVVSTDVGDLQSLGSLLHVASGPEAFAAAIRKALEEKSPKLREQRVKYARANDWSQRARGVAEAILATTGETHG